MTECKHCGYSWKPRVVQPKYCPRCKQNLDRKSVREASSLIQDFLGILAEERQGFRFGSPWRFGEHSLLAILPMLRDRAGEREYVTLEQAQRDGSIIMKDTGDIGTLRVRNAGSLPVYIRMGQIFAGVGTQPRTAVHSIIILPGRSKTIDVKCVSASTPIREDAGFEVGGVVPCETEDVLVQSMVSPEYSSSLQSSVWRTASSFPRESMERLAASPMVSGEVVSRLRSRFTDDLSESTKAFKQLISDILNKVPISENQVGMALLDVAGCRGLEVFDVPVSWRELRDDIVAKHGEAIEEAGESVFQYIPEKAKALVQDVLRQEYHHRLVWEDGPAKTYAIHNGRMAGEVTELNGKIIHMVINRKTQLERPPLMEHPMLDLQERVERSQARLERLMVALEEERADRRSQ